MTEEDTPEGRRTKRRYAHELYPHADEWETRPLEQEVPYRLARAVGFQPEGTGWFNAAPKVAAARTVEYLNEARIALLAVALHEGITGNEAWQWVDVRLHEEIWQLWESCKKYGVNPDQIKPYPCGDEPNHHDHLGPRDARGSASITRVQGKESECLACTEPLPEPSTPTALAAGASEGSQA